MEEEGDRVCLIFTYRYFEEAAIAIWFDTPQEAHKFMLEFVFGLPRDITPIFEKHG